MVFSGKPSAACEECRRRRIKCDLKEPGCSQCRRKGFKCSGYRDLGTLRLRDETNRVTSKLQANSARSSNSSSRSSSRCDSAVNTPISSLEGDTVPSASSIIETRSTGSHSSPCYGLLEDDLILPQPLNLSIHDLAMPYFMTCYIMTTPFEAYLPEMFRAPFDSRHDDPCYSAAVAAAYAALGLHRQNQDLWRSSQTQYARALTRLHESLADPARATSDKTLGAVLLLGLFEAIMFQGGRSPAGWAAHTSGSLELLKLRGREQFQSYVSAQLFAHASTNIKTSCVQRNVPIPPDLIRLAEEAKDYIDPHDPAVFLAPVIHDLARFLVQAPLYSRVTWAYKCYELDVKVKRFTRTAISDKSPYAMKRQLQSTHPWAYESKEAHYANLRHIKVWNILRLLRISLISHIDSGTTGFVDASDDAGHPGGETPPPGFPSHTSVEDVRVYARREMVLVASQVFASIPSFMERDDVTMNQWRFSSPARSLVWPLSLVERSQMCPPAMMEYISLCLEKIATDLNIASAVSAAREVGSTTDWLHLFHLG